MYVYEQIDGRIYKTSSKKTEEIDPLDELEKQRLLLSSMLSLVVNVSEGNVSAGLISEAEEVLKRFKRSQ